MEDSRVTAARDLIQQVVIRAEADVDGVAETVEDLIAYADERLKINVGLIAENAGLKQKISAPPTLDLSAIPTADLLAELAHRLENK